MMFFDYKKPSKFHYVVPFGTMLMALWVGHNLETTWDVVLFCVCMYFFTLSLTVQISLSLILYDLAMYFDAEDRYAERTAKPKIYVYGEEIKNEE